MAEEWRGGAGVTCAAVPVADGRTERGAAKGTPACGRAQHEINESRLSRKLISVAACRNVCTFLMEYGIIGL